MLEIAIIAGATLLVGWIIQTLVSTAKAAGAEKAKAQQAEEAREKLRNATKAGIAARQRDDVFGGLRDSDGHRRD